MMKKAMVWIVVICFLSSCNTIINRIIYSPPKDLPKWQEEKFYDGKSTGLSQRVNLDGLWKSVDSTYQLNFPNQAFLFFEDGTFGELMLRSIDLQKKDIDLHSLLGKRKYWGFGGCYSFREDSICVDNYSLHPYWWYVQKIRFAIISKDTIELVCSKLLSDTGEMEWRYHRQRYVFVSAINLPNPDSVLIKKEKWIWRDEKDWKAFQTKHKRKR